MKLNLTKKIVSILLLLLCFDSFAAVVSDNDGSAFITKAEFDSLKNNFQAQIDNYNTNIDNKIDAAIAGYLAGIKVETTEELESYLNKINSAAEDFYLDGSGNKVKYGYRCMARRFSTPTTQKPNGALTNFFISRNDVNLWVGNYLQYGWARFGLTYNSRTSFREVTIPETNYKIGKYMILDEDSNGNLYSYNQTSNYTYRFYTGGSSFTHGVNNGITTTSSGFGSFSTSGNFVNNKKYWSMDIGEVTYNWDNPSGTDYSTWRCLYGTSFDTTSSYATMPVCGYTNDSVIALRRKKQTEMTIQENNFNWNLYYTVRGVLFLFSDEDTRYIIDKAASTGGLNPDKMTTDTTAPWTFWFNCHPYEQVNTSNLIDNYATNVLGRTVNITDGIPVFKASFDGTVDMKIYFYCQAGHTLGCGFKKEPFVNTPMGYTIDTSLKLRDFNDVLYPNNLWPTNQEVDIRMDVKKNDVIWIKAVDTNDDYAFVGAKTNQIKLTSDKN